MKKCKTCGIEKPLKRFSKNGNTQRASCKNCLKTIRMEQGFDSAYKRDGDLRRRYGISLMDYEKLLESQDSKCMICQEAINGNGNIDHDHKTGQIRGILCHSCNTGIGLFKESTERLQNAVQYLDRWLRG